MKIFNKFICFCICASVIAVPLFVSDAQAQDYPKAKKTHNAPKSQPAVNNQAPANQNYNNGRNQAPPPNYNNNNGRNQAPPPNYNNNNGRSQNPPPNPNYNNNNGRNQPPARYNVPNYSQDFDPTNAGSSAGPEPGASKIMSEPNPNGGNPVLKSSKKNPFASEAEADAAFNRRYGSELSKWKTLGRGYLDNPKYFSRFDNNQLSEMYSSLSVLYSDFERDIVRSDELDTKKPVFSQNVKMHAINSFEQIDHLVDFLEKELNSRKISFKKIKRHMLE